MSMLDLDNRPYIEHATGPRGGKGWRLTAQAVSACTKEEMKAQRLHDTYRALAHATPVAYGELHYREYAQTIHWQLRLPFEFSQYRGQLKRAGHTLSFTINTKGRSVKKVKALLTASCDSLPAEFARAIQAERDYLVERQTRLIEWLASLNGLVSPYEAGAESACYRESGLTQQGEGTFNR